ncbi:hypothetical protein BT96DRAFT_403276 [Gymnopus androsaceus JB14]|uniref:Uncharacterized protein n=1 Tax=Gymnopus androsaceus JB14 TaxID=1447944 RepID=A0A6A4I430_9AGAR|nr:hypothetical protein BT96DRAFT_403276 [Gymnopus androsaceus JB14]
MANTTQATNDSFNSIPLGYCTKLLRNRTVKVLFEWCMDNQHETERRGAIPLSCHSKASVETQPHEYDSCDVYRIQDITPLSHILSTQLTLNLHQEGCARLSIHVKSRAAQEGLSIYALDSLTLGHPGHPCITYGVTWTPVFSRLAADMRNVSIAMAYSVRRPRFMNLWKLFLRSSAASSWLSGRSIALFPLFLVSTSAHQASPYTKPVYRLSRISEKRC